jgi:hypothetical protein
MSSNGRRALLLMGVGVALFGGSILNPSASGTAY